MLKKFRVKLQNCVSGDYTEVIEHAETADEAMYYVEQDLVVDQVEDHYMVCSAALSGEEPEYDQSGDLPF